ncbi:MAG: DUF58 domain-containing protein [Ardenticatenia bacterium]|nr:DUF58 domain-containing protein [Ardenticatenia bacterium]
MTGGREGPASHPEGELSLDAGAEPLLPPRLLARLDRLALLLREGHVGRLQGPRRSPRRGSSVEFADYRAYSSGDDPRRIDWKAYARLDRLFLRLFVAEEDTLLHIVLDCSRSMAWGAPSKLDLGRRLAAALGYLALSNHEWAVAGLVGGEGDGRPAMARALRGKAAAPLLFRQLASLRADGGTDLATGLTRHLSAHRTTGPLVLITDLLDPNWEAALRQVLAAGCELRLIHVLSPEELAPQLDGDFRLVDDETGAALDLSADAASLADYGERLARWQAEVAAWCRARGAVYVAVGSDVDVEDVVLGGLREAGVVG